MAINPAPMDQCQQKFRCLTGPNQGLAYDAEAPCNAGEVFVRDVCDCFPIGTPCSGGIGGTLTSRLSSRAGGATVTTFYPSLQGGVAGGGSRVLDGQIQVFNGTEFVTAGVVAYNIGDEYAGQIITDVVHSFDVAGTCDPIPNTSGCTKKEAGSSNSIMFSCGIAESESNFLSHCSIRLNNYVEITDVREVPNANGPTVSHFYIDAIRTNGFAETISTNVAGADLLLDAGTTFYLYGPGDCLS